MGLGSRALKVTSLKHVPWWTRREKSQRAPLNQQLSLLESRVSLWEPNSNGYFQFIFDHTFVLIEIKKTACWSSVSCTRVDMQLIYHLSKLVLFRPPHRLSHRMFCCLWEVLTLSDQGPKHTRVPIKDQALPAQSQAFQHNNNQPPVLYVCCMYDMSSSHQPWRVDRERDAIGFFRCCIVAFQCFVVVAYIGSHATICLLSIINNTLRCCHFLLFSVITITVVLLLFEQQVMVHG